MANLLNLPVTEEAEIWLPIPGVSPIYRVSNFGVIKSVDYPSYRKIVGKTFMKKGKVLRGIYDESGYKQVTLYGAVKKYKSTYGIHRIVFFSFNPDVTIKKGYEVDHIDNDKENNRLSNLQYIKCRHNSAKRSMNLKKSSQFTGVSWKAAPLADFQMK
jgi:hypothetical protein